MGSEFLNVRCKKCKNQQTIFSKPAMKVHCLVCDELLAESTGGKGKIHAQVLEVIS
jgi:small subunit ribosomal protein S27e